MEIGTLVANSACRLFLYVPAAYKPNCSRSLPIDLRKSYNKALWNTLQKLGSTHHYAGAHPQTTLRVNVGEKGKFSFPSYYVSTAEARQFGHLFHSYLYKEDPRFGSCLFISLMKDTKLLFRDLELDSFRDFMENISFGITLGSLNYVDLGLEFGLPGYTSFWDISKIKAFMSENGVIKSSIEIDYALLSNSIGGARCHLNNPLAPYMQFYSTVKELFYVKKLMTIKKLHPSDILGKTLAYKRFLALLNDTFKWASKSQTFPARFEIRIRHDLVTHDLVDDLKEILNQCVVSFPSELLFHLKACRLKDLITFSETVNNIDDAHLASYLFNSLLSRPFSGNAWKKLEDDYSLDILRMATDCPYFIDRLEPLYNYETPYFGKDFHQRTKAVDYQEPEKPNIVKNLKSAQRVDFDEMEIDLSSEKFTPVFLVDLMLKSLTALIPFKDKNPNIPDIVMSKMLVAKYLPNR
jgi:hypothetical protein